MKKQILRTLSMMIAVMLLLACLPAAAAAKNDGWLSITVRGNKKTNNSFDPEGIQLAAYLIAKGDYGNWKMEKNFTDIEIFTGKDGATKIDLSLDKLQRRIRERHISPYGEISATDAYGKASFSGLEHGIYLVQMVKGPEGLTMSPMLLAAPNKEGAVQISAYAKYTYDDTPPDNPPRIPIITVPIRDGERLVNIDEYETALGLGNIQMHVGVCFE